jgi:hypothetical protein
MAIVLIKRVAPAKDSANSNANVSLPANQSASYVNPRPRDRPSPAPDYVVGYRRPPAHTRFEPGQSGNPRGRPRRAKGLNTVARSILTEKITIRLPSGLKRVTMLEAALHKLKERAFNNDLRALQMLLQLYQSAVPDDPVRTDRAAPTTAELNQHDEAILTALRDSLRDPGDVT